ncbi:hypothetical protein K3M67_01295 [Sphingobium sp. V4]|uniref:hypothetical protein n=1 Tax=Sphingobium sp. V4 TaxID=3038927 RepID=UPI002557D2E7|nr:hypothetical protein [Sphingobium sp. V4]WIW88651.1 hypothetical protein K3M67_01295 [Sphingobium sp. V4]
MHGRRAILCALVALAGCGAEPDDGVGGVSASEARALNEAAALLDARSGAARDEAGLNPAARAAAAADRRRMVPTPIPETAAR